MNTTILSILLGIGGMFGWGIYDFLGGVFAKQIGAFKSLLWSQMAGFVSILLLAVLLKADLNAPIVVLILSLIAAMLYSAGYLFFFKGFELGNVSIIAATMNLWAVFTMVFAFVFMGQRLSVLQTSGVLMIIFGATLASFNWSEIRNQRFQLSAGVKEAVLGAFFFGVFWNVSEIISERVGWVLTTLFVKLGIVLFLSIFPLLRISVFAFRPSLVKQENSWATVPAKTKAIIVLMGVIEAGAVALVNYGLTIGDAIMITPIASALSIVTISLAIIFLKEKISPVQGLGMVTAIAGIIVTAL